MGQEAKKTTVAEATSTQTTNGLTATTISVGQKKPISPQVATVPPTPRDTTPETAAAAMPVTYQMVEHDADVRKLIDHANRNLGVVGYTEHGLRHVTLVARIARNVVRILGYDEHTQELAAIAGILHDIGNVVNRRGHPNSGAVMSMPILQRLGMPMDDIAVVMGATGSHGDDGTSPAQPAVFPSSSATSRIAECAASHCSHDGAPVSNVALPVRMPSS